MVPNTAPLNNVGRVLCQESGLSSNWRRNGTHALGLKHFRLKLPSLPGCSGLILKLVTIPEQLRLQLLDPGKLTRREGLPLLLQQLFGR
jgi:hypothetical protein